MKARTIFRLTIALFVFASCKKESPDINLGKFDYLATSKSAIPYLEKTAVVFVDSLGNEMTLHITEKGSESTESHIPKSGHIIPENAPVGDYFYSANRLFLNLDNDQQNLHFWMWLTPDIYVLDPESKLVADRLAVFYTDPDQPTDGAQIFSYLVDRRSFPSGVDEHEIIAARSFFGREFTNLVENKDQSRIQKMFYNETEGIVAFTDFQGKLWRFERME